MANRRVTMNKAREVVRLKEEGKLSKRKIARALNISRPTVDEYLWRFEASGLTYEDIKEMSDNQLLNLFAKGVKRSKKEDILSEKFEYFVKELKRTGVRLLCLWEEYRREHPDGYSYSRFCYHYQNWRESLKVTMHIDHKAGDKMFVDYTGKKLKIVDRATGDEKDVEVFVAILGASQLTYVEASMSQKKEDWIRANENALLYFGGVPKAIVPDNLKSGVTLANRYEPDINPEYADFARHYETTILPTRPYTAKDKAMVEKAVSIVYTRIFAPLRDQVFYSLEELNRSIRELLEIHNNKRFQRMNTSRWQLFNEVEKEELKPLPAQKYESKKFLNPKVQFNYHIELREDMHYYSVPYQYAGKRVTVTYTASVVEIYHDNIRIASHKRDRNGNKYTTLPEHMSSNHQLCKKWSPQRMIDWGENIGSDVKVMIEEIFKSRQYPEQAFKVCLGILNLSKKYGDLRLNRACERALQFYSYSFKTVNNILKNGLDKVEEGDLFNQELPIHENIRGDSYYC